MNIAETISEAERANAAEVVLASLTPQSTLAELPTWNVRVAASARGDEVDTLLRRNPELPGVVVFDKSGVRGAISRSRFQQVISRPFGGEIVRPRAILSLFADISAGTPLILSAEMPIQEALRQALMRERSTIYEPVLMATGIDDVRLIGFTDLLRADSRISALRNQQIREILATVQEGFLLVGRDHRVVSEYSRSVEIILATSNLAGRPLPEVLLELLGAEQAELAHGYLETLFNPNVIENLVADINPLASVDVLERPGRPRQHLRFTFRRSMEGKAIRRILVRVEDRTREIELAAELEEQQRQAGRRVELAMEMMQVDPSALTDYLTRFLAEVSQLRRLRLQRGDAARATIDAIFRILHGLKGEAGVIGLRTFAQKLHQTEDVVASLRDKASSGPPPLERLDPWIDALRNLGAEAKDLIARLSTLASQRTAEPAPAPPPDLVTALRRLIDDLASRLGKPARLSAQWNPDDVPHPYAGVLRDALIQLARNSMVHGVEAEPQRRQAGKPVPALLQFAVCRHEQEGQLEIVFQDDGRGLDLDGIRRRAHELFGVADLDDAQAAQVIFEPGFSTVETSSADAGRGVGLDLVREKVESLGGAILAYSDPGVFCAFQIVLPLDPEGRA